MVGGDLSVSWCRKVFAAVDWRKEHWDMDGTDKVDFDLN